MVSLTSVSSSVEEANGLNEILNVRVKGPGGHTVGLHQSQPLGFPLSWLWSQSLMASARPGGPCSFPPQRRGTKAEEQARSFKIQVSKGAEAQSG